MNWIWLHCDLCHKLFLSRGGPTCHLCRISLHTHWPPHLRRRRT